MVEKSETTTTRTFMGSGLEENTDQSGNGNLARQILERGGKWKTSVLAFQCAPSEKTDG